MAIKDIIVPAFVGTATIKWIVTRGFSISSVTAPTVPGMEYKTDSVRMHYAVDADDRMHYRVESYRMHFDTDET